MFACSATHTSLHTPPYANVVSHPLPVCFHSTNFTPQSELKRISAIGEEGATRSLELRESHVGLSKEVHRLRERLLASEASSQEHAARLDQEREALAMELEHIQLMGVEGAQSTARLREEYDRLQADYATQTVRRRRC